MNERVQDLLDHVQQTACEVSDAAADAVYGVGKKAGELLSVAKLNIRLMDLEAEENTSLREVGEMVYATHTGTPTESEVLLAKLEEIDSIRSRADALRREIGKLREVPACPICGAESRPGDVFCRECGGKL